MRTTPSTRKARTLVAAAAVAAGGLALAACGTERTESTAADPVVTGSAAATGTTPAGVAERSITVSGEGKVTGRPDTAELSIGVSVDDRTADGALAKANEKAAALIASLKSSGVAADDITTTGLSIYPNRESNNRITGYTASNMVTAKVRDLAKAGPVVDAAATAAGDGIALNGIWFSISDTSDLYAAARAAAMKDAKLRADQLATAGGVQVGKVLVIDETNTSVPMPYAYDRMAASTAGGAPTPIEPGTQDITLTVRVVYELTS